MTTATFRIPAVQATSSQRANALADRLLNGAQALATFASTLTGEEWNTPVSATDRRKIGVVVNHVASAYPVELQLAQPLSEGKPMTGVTSEDIDAMNAEHARKNDKVMKEATLDLLRRDSAEAAAAIRALSDEELDGAAPASLYSDAPLTCQFVLEDHAVRHSYHHLAGIRAALQL
jgi:hypothetical protein